MAGAALARSAPDGINPALLLYGDRHSAEAQRDLQAGLLALKLKNDASVILQRCG